MSRIITRQSLARAAAERWKAQYFVGRWREENHLRIHSMLIALGSDPNPDDVDMIIGNTSWTRPGACDNCGAESSALYMIGQPLDYESHTASVCITCLRAAVKEMEEKS